MRTTKRIGAIILSAILMLCLLSGCGADTNTSGEPSGTRGLIADDDHTKMIDLDRLDAVPLADPFSKRLDRFRLILDWRQRKPQIVELPFDDLAHAALLPAMKARTDSAEYLPFEMRTICPTRT